MSPVGEALKRISLELIEAESREMVDTDTVLRLLLEADRVLSDEIARRVIKERK